MYGSTPPPGFRRQLSGHHLRTPNSHTVSVSNNVTCNEVQQLISLFIFVIRSEMNVANWGQTSDLISTSRLLEIEFFELYFLLPVLRGHPV